MPTSTRVLPGLAAAALLGSQPAPPPPYELVIDHVAVVDVAAGRLRPNQAVAVAGGKIVQLGPTGAARPRARQYLAGRGRYLLPGLWNMHVHFRGGDSLAANKKRTGLEAPLFGPVLKLRS